MTYLLRTLRKKNGTGHESWTLVEAMRTAQRPRQAAAETNIKLPGLNLEE